MMIDEGMRALAEALRQQSAAYGFVARLLRTEVDDEALGRLRAMRFPRAATIISMRAIEGCALI